MFDYRSLKWLAVAFAALALSAGTAQAYVLMETVTVGNAGNDPDTRYATPGFGSVDYVYNIGQYQVTAGQYCTFLNAVAADDTYGLYNPDMWSDTLGCKIEQSGSAGSYTYSVAADWANRPVNYVSWGDAARFANWLQNGQPTGPQDLTTTEDAAYYLNGATTDAELMAVTREPDWKWAITTEDEWHKAAYHKNDGVTGNYFDYPTGTDGTPSNDLVEPTDPGNNATFRDGDYTIGSPYYRTEVGAHENSESPYNTFDQGGNVWEWNEASSYDEYRGMRGGSFASGAVAMHSPTRSGYSDPTSEEAGRGFRVASKPLPGGVSTPINISQNDGNTDREPQVHGSHVVWYGRDDNNNVVIYFCDLDVGGSPTNISQHAVNYNRYPQVHGSHVVWEGLDSDDYEIYHYDLDAGGPPINISQNSGSDDLYPQVCGSHVVWWREDYEIYHYDVDVGGPPTNISQRPGNRDLDPQVCGSHVVWRSWDGNDYEIYHYDLDAGGLPTNISQNDGNNDYLPQVHGSHVVWYGSDGNDGEIFFYDLDVGGPPVNISQSDDISDAYPQVHGSHVVWCGHNGTDYEIYFCDVDGGSPIRISQNLGNNDLYPQVCGSHVVWHDWDATDNEKEIYFYNLDAGGSPINISQNDGNADHLPQVYGQHVVWWGYDGNDYEIFLVILPEPSTIVLLFTAAVGLLVCGWRRRRQ